MKTVVFVLQKSQFSAVIGNERCRFHVEESMSLSDSKPERIVGLFENNDDFKGWNDTKLFILYDSESAKYLFNIIDGFGLKNKVDQCKNFSFQIKLEEKPIDLNGNIAAILEKGDSAAASEIGKLKNEIDDLKKEIEDKNSKNENLNRNIAEKDNEISNLNKQVQTLKDKIAPKDKKIEELQKWYDDWDCYAVGNIISEEEGSILKLKKPIDNIHEIYIFSRDAIEYSKAELHLRKVLKDNWHFPTEKESEILFELYKIPEYDYAIISGSFISLFFERIDEWFIGDGKKFYYANHYGLVTDKKRRICKSDKYGKSVIFVR